MIKEFLFPKNTHNTSTSIALLIMRIVFAGMLVTHGWGKLTNFDATVQMFTSMGMGSASVMVSLVIFAEFFCAWGVVVGLLYRLALIPMVINMLVAFAMVHKFALSGPNSGELAFLYLAAFIVLFITGPGKYALCNLFLNRKKAE
jgi:putative oxidoreductase